MLPFNHAVHGTYMTKPNTGIVLALMGALILTPDSLLMRLSSLNGGEMLAWRASLAGIMFLLIGTIKIQPKNFRSDIFLSRNFAVLVLCQVANMSFFSFAISFAPVALVLITVATVPIIAIALGSYFLGERANAQTWIILGIVITGIIISVFGELKHSLSWSPKTILGALLGLGVAFSLATNFVIIRHDRNVAFEMALGVGAVIAGLCAFTLFPTALSVGLSSGLIIASTGIIILPVSFILLSRAARYTSASNVSLLMLLETALGPLWVWIAIGETPTHFTLIGGTIVVSAIIYFLTTESTAAS